MPPVDRPPSDIHLVCADHAAWEHDGSLTDLWAHLTAEHAAASPTFTVVATGYPQE
jgi:hypothetical protein